MEVVDLEFLCHAVLVKNCQVVPFGTEQIFGFHHVVVVEIETHQDEVVQPHPDSLPEPHHHQSPLIDLPHGSFSRHLCVLVHGFATLGLPSYHQ